MNKLSLVVLALISQSAAVVLSRPDRNPDYQSQSFDMFRGEQSDRDTATMSEADKMYEDTVHQGNFQTGTTSNQAAKHRITGIDATNNNKAIPKHIDSDSFEKAELAQSSPEGVSQVQFTINSIDNAKRLIKQLFSKGLIATAEILHGTHIRHYMMAGRAHTVDDSVQVQALTSDARVTELIDFINKNGPELYDYPVPDVISKPVTNGNPSYLSWVKVQTDKSKGFSYNDDPY